MMKKWCSRVNGITTISSTDQSKSHQYYKYVMMWWCDDGVMMANNRCDGVCCTTQEYWAQKSRNGFHLRN